MLRVIIDNIEIPLSYMLVDENDSNKLKKINKEKWLTDSQIDWLLMHFQAIYSHAKILFSYQIEKAIWMNECLENNFENTPNLILITLVGNNHWITLTNIELDDNVVKYENQSNIYMYDSLNEQSGIFMRSLIPLMKLMYPTKTSIYINRVEMLFKQRGTIDCGLYALSYVYSLLNNDEPCWTFYSQNTMRRNYNTFILNGKYQSIKQRLYKNRKRNFELFELDFYNI